MSKIKELDYAYSVSRIHAVERSLFDKGKIMQIAEAKDAAEALRMIYDGGYTAEADYETSFEKALDEAYALVYSIAPDKEIFDIFLIENDYYNLKVLLKAELLGKDLDYLLNERARKSVKEIKEIVRERRGGDVSEEFDEALSAAFERFSLNKNIQAAEIIIDKACYKEMSAFAKKSGNEFIKGLVKTKIDLINIMTMFRLRKIGGSSKASEAMIEGGSLSIELLCAGVSEAKEALAQSFRMSRYGSIVSDAASVYDSADIETACTDFLIDYMKAAKRVTFGPEPLAAYIFAKENEIKQLRIIMVGKNNNMDSELIKRRLNIAYV